MKLRILTASLLVGAAATAIAQSVAFSENFNGDYTENFPTLLELDHKPPLDNFRPLFTDNQGVARPWWRLRDFATSDDGFLGSHSAYQTPSKSNDWVVSRPIVIPTAGYELSFGAQSFVMRVEGDRVSDLWVFITEEAPAEGKLPTEPVLHIERVPEGLFPADIEKDFTYYTLNLDRWAGKTVYLSFANLNTDKDLLIIDDVVVKRNDKASLAASAPRYVEKGDFTVEVDLTLTPGQTVGDYTVEFNPGTGAPVEKVTRNGLAEGKPEHFTFTAPIAADQTASWSVSFTTEGQDPVVDGGTVSGLAFIPFHRVLVEEATGSWCGNCPKGIFSMEQMTEHEEMKEYVVPVAVHINGSPTDYMVDNSYSYMLGVTAAPAVRIDRGTVVKYFDNAHDMKPVDFDDPVAMATQVKKRHDEITLMDIDLTAAFVTAGTDTTAINATVTLRPAMTLPGAPYRVGFALTENNVRPAEDHFWAQHNYFSGMEGLTGDAALWAKLPEEVKGWHYQDVARGVYDFHGLDEIVMPATLEMEREYEFTATIPIPDKAVTVNGSTMAHPVVAGNLTLVAFVLDSDRTFESVNSAIHPMTELAAKRPTLAEQYDRIISSTGICTPGVEASGDCAPEYFTLQGIRVERPEAGGLYIVRRGEKVTKEIL